MTYDGAVAGVTTIFGEPEEPPIMGVTALETLGYQVDPVTGELKPIDLPMLPTVPRVSPNIG